MSKLLQKVYSPIDFKKNGLALIDKLSTHIAQDFDENPEKVIRWKEPTESLDYWKSFLKNGQSEELFEQVLRRSTHVHNPKYIGHQISPAAPITLLTSLLSAALNNGTAVYEMGMVTNPMERIITELLCNKIGKPNSNAFRKKSESFQRYLE